MAAVILVVASGAGCTVVIEDAGGGGGGVETVNVTPVGVQGGGTDTGFIPTNDTGFVTTNDTGSSGGGTTTFSTDVLERTKASAKIAMTFVISRVLASFGTVPRQLLVSTPCPFGGSFDTNIDGSVTYRDCSFERGGLLNGIVRITPGREGTQGGKIEFDNFRGQSGDGTQFRMDGSIEEIEERDGSLTFRFNFDSSTEGGGELDRSDFQGEVNVQEDGTMSGRMLQESDLGPTACDFDGANIFDLNENPDLYDELCRDLGEPPS